MEFINLDDLIFVVFSYLNLPKHFISHATFSRDHSQPEGKSNPLEWAATALWPPPSWSQRKAPQKDVQRCSTGMLNPFGPHQLNLLDVGWGPERPCCDCPCHQDWDTTNAKTIKWLQYFGSIAFSLDPQYYCMTLVFHPHHFRYHTDPSVSLSPHFEQDPEIHELQNYWLTSLTGTYRYV